MKTNLSNLMSIVSELEKEFSDCAYELKGMAYNASIQELDGTINVVEDCKDEFQNSFKQFLDMQEKIVKIKSAIYEKNNTFKLPDGRTIQEAIVENTNLRKVKSVYSVLLSKRSSKKRITEVNNSYFECKDLNYDSKVIKEEYDKVDKRIVETDFEISKLNSIEFELDI